MKQDVTVELAGGKRLTFETGRLAKQASGSVVVSQGDNVVLATAVAAPDPKEGLDFFPLTVDYREYTYAGGRIPGGFIKREGRPSVLLDPVFSPNCGVQVARLFTCGCPAYRSHHGSGQNCSS